MQELMEKGEIAFKATQDMRWISGRLLMEI